MAIYSSQLCELRRTVGRTLRVVLHARDPLRFGSQQRQTQTGAPPPPTGQEEVLRSPQRVDCLQVCGAKCFPELFMDSVFKGTRSAIFMPAGANRAQSLMLLPTIKYCCSFFNSLELAVYSDCDAASCYFLLDRSRVADARVREPRQCSIATDAVGGGGGGGGIDSCTALRPDCRSVGPDHRSCAFFARRRRRRRDGRGALCDLRLFRSATPSRTQEAD